MRIYLALLQSSKNVLLIKVSHQAPFCSCCREGKDERDTHKGPFFPLLLDRCLKRDWWVRWLPLFCWCSYRQLLVIWAKYRLSLMGSSAVALSNLWAVSQAWTMSQSLEAGWHLCWSCTKSLLLDVGHCSSITSEGAGPISEGQWHIHICIFNLIQNAQKWQWGRSRTCSLV